MTVLFRSILIYIFFFNDTATTEIYTLSLHDALPISSIEKLDATKKEDVKEFLLCYKPEIVINTVALASSVACEKNPELCKKSNYVTAKNIAEICREINAKLIFISSSYVFDGKKGNYNEQDTIFPTNEYAKAKILAEEEVLKSPISIVIRTEPMYGYDENTHQLKFGTGTFQKEIEIGSTDLIRKPIFINDVPRIISKLIERNKSGIFHIAGPEKIIWYDFLKKLSSVVNAESNLKIVDSSKWLLKSPKDSTLDTSKINLLGIQTTSIAEALKKLQKFLNH